MRLSRWIALPLALILLLSGSCALALDLGGLFSALQPSSRLTRADVEAGDPDKLAEAALQKLEEQWKTLYRDSAYDTVDECLLDIRDVRLVRLREDLPESALGLLENVAWVAEFLLYSDGLSAGTAGGHGAGYLSPYYQYDNVLIYRDGTLKCTTRILDMYRARTFQNDYSDIIAEVIDLEGRYDRVIAFPRATGRAPQRRP